MQVALPADTFEAATEASQGSLVLQVQLAPGQFEAQEPVRGEFKAIVDSQQVGIPMSEAVVKLYERMPVPEANFFGIVVSIQQRAGGNLSEALGNLSRVLRERKKMKAKIKAMSMEAKASAVIIAALPFAVMILVYITSPTYIELLWTHPTGRSTAVHL